MKNELCVCIVPKHILMLAAGLQLTLLGLVALSRVGIGVPLLRPVVAFIYLSVIPGALILIATRVRNIALTEMLLYSVGLSLSLLMFVGTFINLFYPTLGISRPISESPLLATLTLLTVLLGAVCYAQRRELSSELFHISMDERLLPCVLALLMLPFLAVFGTYLVNFYDSNILLLILLLIIAAIPLLVAFDGIPEEVYPLAVWVIAIALLFHNSLISIYLWGYDIHSEYLIASKVIENASWTQALFAENVNAMLSVSILSPVISILSSIELAWVYKAVYPIFFAFVPLGLYMVYERQTNSRYAFIACFFFMSFFVFFTEMLTLARQEIAELFFMLLLVVATAKNIDRQHQKALLLTFATSVVISHYGVSYILMMLLVLGMFVVPCTGKSKTILFSPVFVTSYVVFALSYFMYVTRASIFHIAIGLSKNMIVNLKEIFNPQYSGSAAFVLRDLSFLYEIFRFINYVTIFFVILGIAVLLNETEIIKKLSSKFPFKGVSISHYSRINNFNGDILVCSVIAFSLLIMSLLPWFSSGASFGFTRLYHLTLFLLSLVCAIGGITFLGFFLSTFFRGKKNNIRIIAFLALFFSVYLLFSSSFVFEISNDYSTSLSLSKHRAEKSVDFKDVKTKLAFYNAYIPEEDIFSARWLSKYHTNSATIYSDIVSNKNVLQSYGGFYWRQHRCIGINTDIPQGTYIYLRKFNYVDGLMVGPSLSDWWNTSSISPALKTKSKIYSNGGSVIYYG